jgi:uncharacterized protein YcfJ
MRNRMHLYPAIFLAATSLTVTACGKTRDANTIPAGGAVSTTPAGATAAVADTLPAKHHSKLAGAAVGAVAGHMLGGHAVAGAAAGALIQHERNKHHRW